MKIGNIDLGERPLFLAPMEDVTDASFRYICKEFGADMMYTEFVSSDGLIRDAKKSLAKLVTYAEEKPIGIQIYGHIPDAMVEAAKMAENAVEIAGGAGADIIDINFGCPVSKIAGRGAGNKVYVCFRRGTGKAFLYHRRHLQRGGRSCGQPADDARRGYYD